MTSVSSRIAKPLLVASCLFVIGQPAIAQEASQEPKIYYASDIKAAMHKHIAARADENGIFLMHDKKKDKILKLRFVTIHDPVRVIDDNTYFACTDFHVVGDKEQLYDLDFWLNPVTGELKVYEEKVHKEPKKSLLYGWYKQPRYTFVNDRVVPLD